MVVKVDIKPHHVINIERALGEHVNRIIGYNEHESDSQIDDEVATVDAVHALFLEALLNIQEEEPDVYTLEIPDGMSDELYKILHRLSKSPHISDDIRSSCSILYIILDEMIEPPIDSL